MGLLRALSAFEANISDEDVLVISVSIDAFGNADLSLLPFEILCRWSRGERLVIPFAIGIMVLHLYWKYEAVGKCSWCIPCSAYLLLEWSCICIWNMRLLECSWYCPVLRVSKVKTTSHWKYSLCPNTGIMLPQVQMSQVSQHDIINGSGSHSRSLGWEIWFFFSWGTN